MTDTVIANSTADDLRTILRSLLAKTNTAATFSAVARDLFLQNSRSQTIQPLFTSAPQPLPSPAFHTLLCRARVLYGCGLGLQSTELLTRIVTASVGLHWEEGGAIEDALSVVDCDLAAALYNVKDTFGTRLKDRDMSARGTLAALDMALRMVASQMEECGGDNPFERAQEALAEFEF